MAASTVTWPLGSPSIPGPFTTTNIYSNILLVSAPISQNYFTLISGPLPVGSVISSPLDASGNFQKYNLITSFLDGSISDFTTVTIPPCFGMAGLIALQTNSFAQAALLGTDYDSLNANPFTQTAVPSSIITSLLGYGNRPNVTSIGTPSPPPSTGIFANDEITDEDSDIVAIWPHKASQAIVGLILYIIDALTYMVKGYKNLTNINALLSNISEWRWLHPNRPRCTPPTTGYLTAILKPTSNISNTATYPQGSFKWDMLRTDFFSPNISSNMNGLNTMINNPEFPVSNPIFTIQYNCITTAGSILLVMAPGVSILYDDGTGSMKNGKNTSRATISGTSTGFPTIFRIGLEFTEDFITTMSICTVLDLDSNPLGISPLVYVTDLTITMRLLYRAYLNCKRLYLWRLCNDIMRYRVVETGTTISPLAGGDLPGVYMCLLDAVTDYSGVPPNAPSIPTPSWENLYIQKYTITGTGPVTGKDTLVCLTSVEIGAYISASFAGDPNVPADKFGPLRILTDPAGNGIRTFDISTVDFNNPDANTVSGETCFIDVSTCWRPFTPPPPTAPNTAPPKGTNVGNIILYIVLGIVVIVIIIVVIYFIFFRKHPKETITHVPPPKHIESGPAPPVKVLSPEGYHQILPPSIPDFDPNAVRTIITGSSVPAPVAENENSASSDIVASESGISPLASTNTVSDGQAITPAPLSTNVIGSQVITPVSTNVVGNQVITPVSSSTNVVAPVATSSTNAAVVADKNTSNVNNNKTTATQQKAQTTATQQKAQTTATQQKAQTTATQQKAQTTATQQKAQTIHNKTTTTTHNKTTTIHEKAQPAPAPVNQVQPALVKQIQPTPVPTTTLTNTPVPTTTPLIMTSKTAIANPSASKSNVSSTNVNPVHSTRTNISSSSNSSLSSINTIPSSSSLVYSTKSGTSSISNPNPVPSNPSLVHSTGSGTSSISNPNSVPFSPSFKPSMLSTANSSSFSPRPPSYPKPSSTSTPAFKPHPPNYPKPHSLDSGVSNSTVSSTPALSNTSGVPKSSTSTLSSTLNNTSNLSKSSTLNSTTSSLEYPLKNTSISTNKSLPPSHVIGGPPALPPRPVTSSSISNSLRPPPPPAKFTSSSSLISKGPPPPARFSSSINNSVNSSSLGNIPRPPPPPARFSSNINNSSSPLPESKISSNNSSISSSLISKGPPPPAKFSSISTSNNSARPPPPAAMFGPNNSPNSTISTRPPPPAARFSSVPSSPPPTARFTRNTNTSISSLDNVSSVSSNSNSIVQIKPPSTINTPPNIPQLPSFKPTSLSNINR